MKNTSNDIIDFLNQPTPRVVPWKILYHYSSKHAVDIFLFYGLFFLLAIILYLSMFRDLQSFFVEKLANVGYTEKVQGEVIALERPTRGRQGTVKCPYFQLMVRAYPTIIPLCTKIIFLQTIVAP